jgi:hypothetical protein
MKATIEIPDDLYRRVKAKSALQGRPIRAVTIELFQRWLDEAAEPAQQRTERTPEQWLADFLRLGEEAFKNAPPGPSAREILEEDRNRLERR